MEKSWNEQLKEWIEKQKLNYSQFERKYGIPDVTVRDYVTGKTKYIKEERRKRLYEITGLGCFKPEGQEIVPTIQETVLVKEKSWNEQLSEWMKTKELVPASFEKNYGIPRRTVKDYIQGKIKTVGEDRKKRLYEITELECFKPEVIIKPPLEKIPTYPLEELFQRSSSLEHDIYEFVNFLQSHKPASEEWKKYITQKDTKIDTRVSNIKNMLIALRDELEYFKKASPEERMKLAKTIPPKDIGYLTGLLNALYSEDAFKGWILETRYFNREKHG